jgi:hypothetical protein
MHHGDRVTVHQQHVVRPPQELAPLIQQDLAEANRAAADAALPYHQAAGEKLLEAKASLAHGEFESWIKRNLKISQRQARRYMQLARAAIEQNGLASPNSFKSISDAIRQTSDPNYNRRRSRTTEGPRARSTSADREAVSMTRKLAKRMVNVGYKSLAQKMHPDCGGSTIEMASLNDVRGMLLALVDRISPTRWQ